MEEVKQVGEEESEEGEMEKVDTEEVEEGEVEEVRII